VLSKDIPESIHEGNEDHEDYIRKGEMNIIRDIVSSRQNKTNIIQKRKSNKTKSRYESLLR
jgi:hypothetical protein